MMSIDPPPSSLENAIIETPDTKTFCKPSQVKHAFRVYYNMKEGGDQRPEICGKWLVFRYFDNVDETWENIRTALARNELGGCISAKCSTARYNPTRHGPGPVTTVAISVYTEEHNIDDIVSILPNRTSSTKPITILKTTSLCMLVAGMRPKKSSIGIVVNHHLN